MLDRFKVLTASLESSVQNAPAVLPPLSHFRAPTTADAAPILGLAPGAQWDTKRWPAGHFAELLRLYRNAEAGQVRIYLGPREAGWFPHSDLARIAAQDDAVELVQLPDLPAVAQSLATLSVLATNDSGLLHLAEMAGTPVLAFFGPTVREFGYFPLLKRSRVLERDEPCRPCSRNGKRPCWRKDLACLDGITPVEALATLQRILAEGVS